MQMKSVPTSSPPPFTKWRRLAATYFRLSVVSGLNLWQTNRSLWRPRKCARQQTEREREEMKPGDNGERRRKNDYEFKTEWDAFMASN